MFQKIIRFGEQLKNTVKLTPIEIVACLWYWLFCIANVIGWVKVGYYGLTFPICFGIIYSTNRFTRENEWRWLYYASSALIVGMFFWGVKIDSIVYWVSLFLSQLVVVYSRKEFENESFIKEGIKYISDMASAICLGTICFLLSIAIYFSFVYIFEVQDSYYQSFESYSLTTAYLFLTPVFFLGFNTKPMAELRLEGFASLLVNFILSPALLIYMVILYLYFAKITLLWSLPKGGVSYMVTSFIILAYALRSVQPMMKKRSYDWFYNYFSWWVLPSLVMLWVGISYRIEEYGFTANRFYLLLGAISLTLVVITSFRLYRRNYAFMVAISALLFAVFTYIPGISAKDIGVASQMRCLKKAMNELNIVDGAGHISRQARLNEGDGVSMLGHKKLYDSFKFLEREKGEPFMIQHFGMNSEYMRDSLINYDPYKMDHKQNPNIFLYAKDWIGEGMDIRDYSRLERPGDGKTGINCLYTTNDGYLTLERGGEVIARLDMNKWLQTRLVEAKLDPNSPHTWDDLQKHSNHFMICDMEQMRLIFDRLGVDGQNNKILDLEISYILLK